VIPRLFGTIPRLVNRSESEQLAYHSSKTRLSPLNAAIPPVTPETAKQQTMAPNSKLNAKRKAQREGGRHTHKPRPTTGEVRAPATSPIPVELQQLLLNIFSDSFAERLSSDFGPLLQEVKGHLYNRDFATAFEKTEYLETYAARWSPSRALGYAELFWDMREQLWDSGEKEMGDGGESAGNKSRKVVCLGGGAGAEIVALGGLQKLLSNSGSQKKKEEQEEKQNGGEMEVVNIDMADWSTVVENLTAHLTTAPVLSKYASAVAQAANVPFIKPEDVAVTFHQHDVLQTLTPEVSAHLSSANLITLLFTLNELYTMSLPLTQKFLLHMTSILSPGALLLVIDSPGSYSSVTLNGAEKKYPMQWLLDHTLLKVAGERDERGKEGTVLWEKVVEEESRWWRLSEELKYPIELEDGRCQVHLYRRL
jgi:25S rRNA (uracil2843-N3)-methyltransferase